MSNANYHAIHDLTLSQIYTKNVIAPNFSRLTDLSNTKHELYNFSLSYAGNMWKYQYSGLNAILGEYDEKFAKNAFAGIEEVGMSSSEGTTLEREIGVLYIMKFSSVGNIIAGGLTNFAGEATKISTATYRLTGILSQNWIVHGLDSYIANTRKSLISGESAIFEAAHSSLRKVGEFYTNLSIMRNKDGITQLLSEAKDESANLEIKLANLKSRELVSSELTKILNFVEDLARKSIPELGIGDRLMSDYKVALNSKVVREIKATGYILPSTLFASTVNSTIGNLAPRANELSFSYQGVDFVGVQEIPEDQVLIMTPKFTIAPIKPLWTGFDNLSKTMDMTGGIAAIVPRVTASATEKVNYSVALGSPTGTGEFAKVESIKPCISIWNQDTEDLALKTDKFAEVRDLALVSTKIV
jgi:hypothetical protein